MESKIIQIRRDIRAIRKNSKALKRLIELQGMYFLRIEALEKTSKSKERDVAIEKQKLLLESLDIEGFSKACAENEERYMDAINKLEPLDKAMLLDSVINGKQNWEIGVKYGYTENGARKHIARIIEKLAKIL